MTGAGEMAIVDWSMIGVKSYAAIASKYDRLHNRFLAFAGASGQSRFEGAVIALVQPGMKILDAACGTGAFASRFMKMTDCTVDLTLLDACPEMLNQSGDIAAKTVLGRLEQLPFGDESFDLVTCAWGIETTSRPRETIAELLRTVRSGGYHCFVACAAVKSAGLGGWIMQKAIAMRHTGQFIAPELGEKSSVIQASPSPAISPVEVRCLQ